MGENFTKEEREKLHEQEKLNLINKEKSSKSRKKFLFILIILIIVGGVLYYGISTSAKPGKYDDFAKCLTEKEAIFAGAFWCNHCADQKKLFGKSIKYVNYVECDARGDNARPEFCQKEDVTGYPTWIINGTKYEGVLQLESLAKYSGCILNN